jgi:V/A-type H+-transporting ATPase subunit F
MGDRDSIYGFAALGLDVYPTDDAAQAAKKLRRLAENGYAVIYMTESLAAALEPEVDRYRSQRTPAIIPIPGVSGNTGAGMAHVRKSVEQAVGSDIIFNGENEKSR